MTTDRFILLVIVLMLSVVFWSIGQRRSRRNAVKRHLEELEAREMERLRADWGVEDSCGGGPVG